MSKKQRTPWSGLLMGMALTLGLAAQAQAAPITGDPVGNDFGWSPNSTNALNYSQMVPGREGQIAPYVLFNSSTAGSIFLDFFNYTTGLAFFEYRIDGTAAGSTSHPVVTGDTIHPGVALSSGSEILNWEVNASQFVDVRLALGGERDWDFDWVRFNVAGGAEPVPVPAPLALLLLGFLGLVAARRRA